MPRLRRYASWALVLALLCQNRVALHDPAFMAAATTVDLGDQALVAAPTQFRLSFARSARVAAMTPVVAFIWMIRARVAFSDGVSRLAAALKCEPLLEDWRRGRLKVGLWIYRRSPAARLVRLSHPEVLVSGQGAVIAANHLNQSGVDGLLLSAVVILVTGRWLTFAVADHFKDPFMNSFAALLVKHGLAIPTASIHNLWDLRREMKRKKQAIAVNGNGAMKNGKSNGFTAKVREYARRGRLVLIFPAGHAATENGAEASWHTSFIHGAEPLDAEGLPYGQAPSAGLPVIAAAVRSQTGFPVAEGPSAVFQWLRKNFSSFRLEKPALEVQFARFDWPDGGVRASAGQKIYDDVLDFVSRHAQISIRPPVAAPVGRSPQQNRLAASA